MSDVITTTAEVRVCTAETINNAALDILNAYKTGVECSDEQLAILAKALCDSNRALKDYTAEQVAKVAEFSVATNDKVVELVKDLEQFKPLLDVLGDDNVDKIEQLKALLDLLSSDVGVLKSLVLVQAEIAATKAEVSELKTGLQKVENRSQKNEEDIATIKGEVSALQDKSQSNVLCIVADSFTNTANELRKLVNCDARKTKLNEALACVTTPYTPTAEYQWAGNPADLAPSMTIPVLDTVVTPVYDQSSVTDTVNPTVVDTTFVEPTVSPAMEFPTYVEPVVEVVAPEVIVEPIFVVTSDTNSDGVLFEVLSNGNMRKTDVDGTETVTNSMGDLV